MYLDTDGGKLSENVDGLLDRLCDRLWRESRVIVAYSGGVDSALLAKVHRPSKTSLWWAPEPLPGVAGPAGAQR